MLKRSFPFVVVLSSLLVLPVTVEAARPRHEATPHAEVITGRVVIETAASGDVLIAIDVRNRVASGDGMAEHVFILQRQDMLLVEEDYPRAQVVFRDSSLEVRPPEPQAGYLFTLADVHDDVAPGVERVEGFGLSRTRGRFPIASSRGDSSPLSRISAHFEEQFKDGGGGSGGASCQAGGQGATSCSLTCDSGPCSVSCSSGYYACCRCSGLQAYCTCFTS